MGLRLRAGLLITVLFYSFQGVSAVEFKEENENYTKILNQYSAEIKKLDTFYATYFNVEEDLSKFGDFLSPELKKKNKVLVAATLKDLKKIHLDKLDDKNKVSYQLFMSDLLLAQKEFDFPSEYLSLNQIWNRFRDYLDDSSPALSSFPFDSVKHYNDFIKRSEGFLPFVDRQIEALKLGIKNKVVLSCPIAEKVPNTYKEGMEKDVIKNPFYRPVLNMPKEISEKDQADLKTRFATMIEKNILPGFIKFDKFYKTEYMPHCRKGFGFSSLPMGKKWYQFSIQYHTNSNKSANEIHQLGLKEVKRISTEMEKVKKQLGFKGSLKEFLLFTVNDKNSYYNDPKELIGAYQKVKTEIASKIPEYFKVKPVSDYKIVETENPEDTSAKYQQPTEMLQHGRFIINTMNLKSNLIHDVTTLSLHEAIPGHHFQLALQFEMKDKISEYQRKIFSSTAFVEGWALYAEYLGREMNLFHDSKQMFGHLSAEMLRAVRLVVDTGIHEKNWSREKAIQYMKDHLANDIKDIESEVDRYSVWPGQALAYKMGQLKILELRHRAEKKLGSQFDIKEFHEKVIGLGSISLSVLENQVDQWIQYKTVRGKL